MRKILFVVVMLLCSIMAFCRDIEVGTAFSLNDSNLKPRTSIVTAIIPYQDGYLVKIKDVISDYRLYEYYVKVGDVIKVNPSLGDKFPNKIKITGIEPNKITCETVIE